MERNMALRIHPETFDLSFDRGGVMETLVNDMTTAQCVRLTLLAYKGDFPLDMEHGTDYDRVLGHSKSDLEDDDVSEVIREAIFQEKAIARVDRLEIARDDSPGRGLRVAFTGMLYNGQTIDTEVNL